jgi:nucleotide-binding universal stress UspA family protein
MLKSGIKRILVPLDGSKNSIRGLDNAIYLARQCQATITGIYVLPRVPVATYRKIQYPEKELLKDADRNMEYAKKHSAQNGIVFEKKVSFGDPGYAIVKYAKGKFDIIVIGARGRGSIKEIFFGSVSNYVLHKANIPVLIVK